MGSGPDHRTARTRRQGEGAGGTATVGNTVVEATVEGAARAADVEAGGPPVDAAAAAVAVVVAAV